MEITQEMKERIVLSLLRNEKTPEGVECSFFRFGDVGVKFYGFGDDAKETAKQAYECQRDYFFREMAPKPGYLFSFELKGAGEYGKTAQLHGYTTEVAITHEEQYITDDDAYTVQMVLRDLKLAAGDIHRKNVGRIINKDGTDFKMVPIDFGRHLFGIARYNAASARK